MGTNWIDELDGGGEIGEKREEDSVGGKEGEKLEELGADGGGLVGVVETAVVEDAGGCLEEGFLVTGWEFGEEVEGGGHGGAGGVGDVGEQAEALSVLEGGSELAGRDCVIAGAGEVGAGFKNKGGRWWACECGID